MRISLLAIFLLLAGAGSAADKITIGAIEEILLLPWGIRVPARVDTGALRSTLDARNLKVKEGNLAEFQLPKSFGGLELQLPIIEWVYLRSGLGSEWRPVVEITLCVGTRKLRAEVTLDDRSELTYPFLLGRHVLEGNFVVDVSRTKTVAPNCPKGPSP